MFNKFNYSCVHSRLPSTPYLDRFLPRQMKWQIKCQWWSRVPYPEDRRAFYKEIPKAMADRVARPFPTIFNKILDAVREETVYGKLCKTVE